MGAVLISLFVFFIVFCIFIYHVIFREKVSEKITKTSASIMFLATAITAVVTTKDFSASTILLCVGLFLSIFGDFFLIKQLRIKHSFVIGVAFFFSAQIAYIVAFSILSPITWKDIAALIIVYALIYTWYRALKFDAKNLRIPLFTYAASLSFMMIKSISVFLSRPLGFNHALAIAVAGILFFFSDLVIAYGVLSGGRTLRMRLINLVAYYFAQILFAFSIYIAYMF